MRKNMFESKIASRGTLPDPKVIGDDPSRHILASTVSQNHRPSTFGVLLESTLTMVVEVVVVVGVVVVVVVVVVSVPVSPTRMPSLAELPLC